MVSVIRRGQLTDVYNPNIHAKRLAREISHVAHVVAEIPDGDQPVEDGGPDGGPRHEVGIDSRLILDDDVVDGVIEQGDQTGDSDNRERLRAQDAEDHGREGRGEQGLVDAEELACAAVHVEGVGQGRKEAAR